MPQPQFNPWDPAIRPDPRPFYHRMRREAPVYRALGPITRQPFWFLTRHADVAAAQRHPDLIRDPEALPAQLRARYREARIEGTEPLSRHLLNLDPPDHTRLRRLVAPAFGPRTVAKMRPRITEVVNQLLAGMAASGEAELDLIETLASPLPVTVIAELLGIPIDDQAQFRGWVEDLLTSRDNARVRAAGAAFIGYLSDHITRRRCRPGDDDLLAQLVQVEEQGDRLSQVELLSTAFLLLVAGHVTTVNLVASGVLELLRHPDQLALLRAQPELIDQAIEEILRYNGPLESALRTIAATDVAFGSVVIPRGEAVVPVLFAANHDPEVFPDPDRFDLTRHPNRHLGFGGGIHFCLGAPLARLEGQIAIDLLLRRFPKLALAQPPAQLRWSTGIALRGVRALPVRLG